MKSIVVFLVLTSVAGYFVGKSVAQSNETKNEYEQNIFFNFYKNTFIVHRSNLFDENLSNICNPSQPWAIIVHGWKELGCGAVWVSRLIKKLTRYRGGCIVCMDYYAYSKGAEILDYVALTTQFDNISDVLLKKLKQFERDNFDPSNGFMFGFSFGAQLTINAGRDFGGKLSAIDTCDPAGPLFYPNSEYQARGSPRLAAKNVQTIHTSTDFGTLERDSHQDWLMGNCGVEQPGSAIEAIQMLLITLGFKRMNHIMCPSFYIDAFDNKFLAVPNNNCAASSRNVKPVPRNYTMGYWQKYQKPVLGTLYAYTYKKSPYNRPAAGEYYKFYQ